MVGLAMVWVEEVLSVWWMFGCAMVWVEEVLSVWWIFGLVMVWVEKVLSVWRSFGLVMCYSTLKEGEGLVRGYMWTRKCTVEQRYNFCFMYRFTVKVYFLERVCFGIVRFCSALWAAF